MANHHDPDEDALDLLSEVRLEFFKAEPSTIAPFESAKLSWSVDAPEGVAIRLDTTNVAKSGSRNVAPQVSRAYRLSARVRQTARNLATIPVHVNAAHCIELDTGVLPEFLAGGIEQKIIADTTSGVYFRRVATNVINGQIVYGTAKPQVWITPNRLHIFLQLAQHIENFPDADVDLRISFGLRVVHDALDVIGPTWLAPLDDEITVDITVVWWAWLIPGAAIGLPIAISGAKDRARARASAMIAELVGKPTLIPSSGKSLNTFFATPTQIPNAQKHYVRLYVDEDGDGIFAVTFCSRSEPGIAADPAHE